MRRRSHFVGAASGEKADAPGKVVGDILRWRGAQQADVCLESIVLDEIARGDVPVERT